MRRFARSAAKVYAPIPNPPQIRDFLCFEQHLKQGFATARKVRAQGTPDPEAALREMEEKGVLAIPPVWYERPNLLSSETGSTSSEPRPRSSGRRYSNALDFELEFGCYIGKVGKDIPREKAREHIFGYTIFNDMSARDEQMKDMPGQTRSWKRQELRHLECNGPCLVTADETRIRTASTWSCASMAKNGVRGNSRDMYWKFEDLIAHVSRSKPSSRRSFLGSGTVGNGCGMSTCACLKPGNMIELEVEAIGVLRNVVVRRD
jgi:2-keto-4-pentenoate hydratase/2-oxohepta-3-ene-1,7-dioic acid hydratase in catechol pathway